jgi:hypothetical protein
MTGSETSVNFLVELEFRQRSSIVSWNFDSGVVAVGSEPTPKSDRYQAEVQILALHRPSQRTTLYVPLKGEYVLFCIRWLDLKDE